MQPMSTSVLDELVLSKPYFDRQGLIIAEAGGKPIGFAHAGFGPNEEGSDIAVSKGFTCMLMTTAEDEEVANQLLAESESFLRARGAESLYGGSLDAMGPFYLGLYGGSRVRGVLASDVAQTEVFLRNGYQAADEYVVLQRELTGFRPLVDRKQMQLRRSHNVEATMDPRPETWWAACNVGQTDHSRFEVRTRGKSEKCGSVVFWEMQPIASGWGVQSIGLLDLEIDRSMQRTGLATFLLGEALRQLIPEGASLVEVQVRLDNEAALGLFKKLGFKQVDRGAVFRKMTPAEAKPS